MARSIHLISPVAGFGNALDLDIAGAVLEENGFDVVRYPVQNRGKAARFAQVAKRIFRGRFDANVFLAPIFPEWLPMAHRNVLVPNAEGFGGHLMKWLPRIDLVLAKTRLTERVFRELGRPTEFTSFTSRDNLREEIPREDTTFFHSCSSQLKGTKRLLETWKRHPEWPELIAVVNNNETVTPDLLDAPNIRAIRQRLSGDEIVRLQNSAGFHICSSEAEGFGHFIMEAMSCRAVTLATDAPPMNELVQADRGLLLGVESESVPMNLSRRYFFKPESLEAQVEAAVKMSGEQREKIGAAARAFFLENDRLFRQRFVEVLRKL